MLDLAFLSTSDYSGSKLNYVTQCPKFQRPYFLSFFFFSSSPRQVENYSTLPGPLLNCQGKCCVGLNVFQGANWNGCNSSERRAAVKVVNLSMEICAGGASRACPQRRK